MARIKKLIAKLKPNLIIWAILPIALIAPDFITKIFNSSNQVVLSGKFIAGLYGFALFFSFTPRYFAFPLLGFQGLKEQSHNQTYHKPTVLLQTPL